MRNDKAVVAEYARLAARYDERWASYIEASVGATLRRLPDVPYRRMLDVGCGTGALLEPLAARPASAQLFGIDSSAPMLRIARSKLPPEVELFRARAEQLPFQSDSFDLVASVSALHYFTDIEQAVLECHRVLRPGGRVLITDWCADYLSSRLFDRLWRLIGRANFRILRSTHLRKLMRGAGFADVEVDRYRVDWLWGLMTVVAAKPAA